MADVSNQKIQRIITIIMLIALFALSPVRGQSHDGRPVADTGSSRYAAMDPVQLDGTASYDPDDSGPLIYAWQQISGPSVVISDANTATPTISGFVQTNEIQECEFELVVSDGELTSLPDTVKVIIVSDFGENMLILANDSFDPNKPTCVWFWGGDCISGVPFQVAWSSDEPDWLSKANIIDFPMGYEPDPNYTPGDVDALRTYYRCGDMIIVFLSRVAPDYEMPIQTMGFSTGGQPAIDVGIHLNLTYADARYAINRVSLLDARSCREYSDSIRQFLDSAVDGEQCWIDNHRGGTVGQNTAWPSFYPNVLRVGSSLSHTGVPTWYGNSLTNSDMNQFNQGVVGGTYWSVVGPGRNLQLASTPGVAIYSFRWHGGESSGYMDFFDELNHPGRLPEPVTLLGPVDVGDSNGAVLTCEESENAVGYQLLFGSDPYRVMDYNIISDTPDPPNEVIITLPFEETFWTVRAYDQFGSTIYADPICTNAFRLSLPIKNLNKDKRYSYIQFAIDDAMDNDEIVLSEGIYQENIDFNGKNLTLRSTNPHDPQIVATTVITGDGNNNVVTFSGGEDANCVLAGFTITGGKRGIYCSGSSPIVTNCTITGNVNADMGAGMYIENGSNPTLVNCMFSSNSASLMGGGMYTENSSPILINCTFAGNSATYYLGGGIYCAGGSLELTNCILWSGTPDEITIYSGNPVITYSNIQGGFTGEGNIDADPLFADPNNGDYHLKSQAGRWDSINQTWTQDEVTSPCIDAGDPMSPIGWEPFPSGGFVNMGAYGGTAEASKSPSVVHAQYSGGTGESNDPYQIATAADLIRLGERSRDYDKHFILTADIDLDPNLTGRKVFDKAVIAQAVSSTTRTGGILGTPFIGFFNGNGHTISHLTIEGVSFLGVFGQLGVDGIVSNLRLEAVNVNGTGSCIGGLVAFSRGSIIASNSTGTVRGDWRVGGLVGRNYYGTITNSYSTGTVTGNNEVGGLVGWNQGGLITMGYSTSTVSGNGKVGGLVGMNDEGSITSSFWDIVTSGLPIMCGSQSEEATGCDDSYGKNTAEMRTASIFLEAGWDFVDETENGTDDIWWILDGQDYPRLWWENAEQ